MIVQMPRTILIAAAALAASLTGGSPAAVHAESSFAGETLKIVVPYGVGGTYDKYGRTFSEHLARHIPGNPNIIVQNMPGAGGLKGMNWFYKLAPKDGKTMIVPLDNSVVNQLMRPKQAGYDARKLHWLGSSNQTNVVLCVRSDSGVRTFEDMKKTPLIAGSVGQAGTSYLMTGLVRGIFNLDVKIVEGYKGSSTVINSVERGETQFAAYNWLAWSSKVPHWFKGEKPFARPILQMGVFRDPDLPKSIPMLSDLVTDPVDQKAVDFIRVLGLLGRGLALPPDTPDEVVATFRAAYDTMNADPAFEADLRKRHLRLMKTTGEEIEKIVRTAIDAATPEVVAHARALIYDSGS